MKLTRINPEILKEEIKYIYILETGGGDKIPELHRHLPDGTFDLIINLGEPIYYFDENGKITQRPDNILIGGYKKFFHLKYPPNTQLIGVIFQPGYASMFVKDRLDLISESFIPAQFVFGKRINNLAENLHITESIEMRRQLIESYLLRRLNIRKSFYLPRIALAFEILCKRQKIRVGDVAREVCMSERNFRRIFSESTGYKPQEIINITRTKKFTHLKVNCTREGQNYQIFQVFRTYFQ